MRKKVKFMKFAVFFVIFHSIYRVSTLKDTVLKPKIVKFLTVCTITQ